MIKLDITGSPFINDVHSDEGDQWMITNIGDIVSDSIDGSWTVGNGWKLYFNERRGHDDHGHWFIEFEDEKHAILFLLRWS